jgi:hypothetical protein
MVLPLSDPSDEPVRCFTTSCSTSDGYKGHQRTLRLKERWQWDRLPDWVRMLVRTLLVLLKTAALCTPVAKCSMACSTVPWPYTGK